MPASAHRLDNTPDHEFTTLIATRCEEHMKITFAVFASFEFIEDAILERAKALRTAAKWARNFLNIKLLINLIANFATYTKHCVCQSSPLELTIFSLGSKPSAQRAQCIAASDMSAACILKGNKLKKNILLLWEY